MSLTDEEKFEAMTELLEDKLGFELETIGNKEQLIIGRMVEVYDNTKGGVQSQSISDLSISFFAEQDPLIQDMIASLRKLKW